MGETHFGNYVRWAFRTLVGNTTYVFAINPNTMDSFFRSRTLDVQTTTAPDGQAIISEGARQPKQASFGGIILDQAQHDALLSWLETEPSICYLYDHYGRRWTVLLVAFDPTPSSPGKNVRHYWRHDYKITVLVLDAPVYDATRF